MATANVKSLTGDEGGDIEAWGEDGVAMLRAVPRLAEVHAIFGVSAAAAPVVAEGVPMAWKTVIGA